MSSPILPTRGPRAHPSQPLSPPSGAARPADFASVMAADPGGHIDVSRGTPPADVLEQVEAAGKVNDQLRESGMELRFSGDGEGARTTIELVDRSGRTIRTLTVAEALEIAAGKPVE